MNVQPKAQPQPQPQPQNEESTIYEDYGL